MKTMEQWKEILKNIPKNKLELKLKDTLNDIKFLESIYMTGGEFSHFNEPFKNAAYNERQSLCQLSSALYELIRNK